MFAMHRVIVIGGLALGLVLLSQSGQAQNPRPPDFGNLNAKFQQIQWQQGPCKATMRHIGVVDVPRGYKFTGEAGTAILMELTQNLPRPNDLGLLCPESWNINGDPNVWFLVFEWDEIGYVKDDDKNLDANAILDSIKKSQEQANVTLRARGFSELTIVGWERAPFYDEQTKLLTWATRVRDSRGGESVNYNSRLLGRGGVMSVNLVIVPHLLQQELPKYKEIVKATSFQSGQKYSEWRAGDKVAAYGLAALVTGGAAAALAKSGLLGKLGKFIIYIVVGIVAVIGVAFKKIFGRGSTA